jgi:hypothetical protein
MYNDEMRDSSNRTIAKIYNNEIRDTNNNTIVKIVGEEVRDTSNRTLIKMPEIRKLIDNSMGGHSLVALWVAYIR